MFVMMFLVPVLMQERSITRLQHHPGQGYIILPRNQAGTSSAINLVICSRTRLTRNAIAVVIINPASGISANTTATDSSPAGDYPIIVGGCYFNPNYRIVFQDGILTVQPDPVLQNSKCK